MIKAVAIFTLFCVFSVQGASIKSFAEISIAKFQGVSPFALSGWYDGGVSRIVDIRFPGCSSAPCAVSSGQQISLEIDFMPRDMHWEMAHRGIIMKETQLTELSEGGLPDSTVQAGQQYTLTYPFTVNTPFSGTSEFRLKVFQNYVMEILISIPLNIG